MKKFIIKIFKIILVSLTCFPSTVLAEEVIKVGTGSITGVYFPLGASLCKIYNKIYNSNQCYSEASNGSEENLKSLMNGSLDLAFIQSDIATYAYLGQGDFADKNFLNMRIIAALNTEAFTLISHSKSKVHSYSEFKEKIINVGHTGSGSYSAFVTLNKIYGEDSSSFKKVLQLSNFRIAQKICSQEVDGSIIVAGFPVAFVNEVMKECRVKIIPVEGRAVDEYLNKNNYLFKVKIPGGLYIGNDEDINTIGVKNLLITSEKENEDKIYQITKIFVENLTKIKASHPALESLDIKDLIDVGINVPIHEGSLKYYREIGLIK